MPTGKKKPKIILNDFRENNTISDTSSASDQSQINNIKNNIDEDNDVILDSSTYIGPITDKLIKSLITEIKKEKNMKMIQENIIDPVICNVYDRYFPHMMTTLILILIIICLLLYVVVLNVLNFK